MPIHSPTMSPRNKVAGDGEPHPNPPKPDDDNDNDRRKMTYLDGDKPIHTAKDNMMSMVAAAPGRTRLILDWRMCVKGIVFTPVVDVRVQLPGFVVPCPLPHPAMCIHVVVDRGISLGVPYIANRRALVRRTLTEDMDLRYVNFEHRHIATEAGRFVGLAPEQQPHQHQHISAGLFICHPADILVVEGWRECENRWLSSDSSKNRYTGMARRGRQIRDMWPWVGKFATVSLQ